MSTTIGRTKNPTGTKQPVEALEIGALGLAGRYLGGQATHQGQRFWARGEDPDQFAGWFGQSK